MNKLSTIFLSILLSITLFKTVNAQGSWVQKANFGGVARDQCVSFTSGNYAYVGLGYATVGTNYGDFWKYDPTTNSWTQVQDFPGAARFGSVAFSIDGKGYVGLGSSLNELYVATFYSDFWQYDPDGNSWSPIADFPGGRRRAAIAFSIDFTGYVGTGLYDPHGTDTLNVYSDMWAYDPFIDEWTQKNDYSGGALEKAACFIIGNTAYVGNGDDNFFNGGLFAYDSDNDTWTQKSSFPLTNSNSPREFPMAFADANYGYMGGGYTQDGMESTFYRYDPNADSWGAIASFPGGIGLGSAFFLNGVNYVCNGDNSTLQRQNFLYQYLTTQTPTSDAGINMVHSPASLCGGSQPVKVRLKNYSSSALTSVNIQWKVNSTSQTTYNWTGALAANDTALVTVGNYSYVSGAYSIKAWTNNPNGGADANQANDTSSLTNISMSAPVVPLVSLSDSPGGALCAGTEIIFNAIATNGGPLPTYQWEVNGKSVGSNLPAYKSSTVNDKDTVKVIMTSNANCVSPKTATSNSIIVMVNEAPVATIALAGTNATSSQFITNWNAVPGATNYLLDVSLHSNFSSFLTGYNNVSVGNVTSFAITGLVPGTAYYYRVRAGNDCATSGNSNTIAYATTTCATLNGGTVTPASTIICPGTTQLLTLNGALGGTLQWQISTDNINWNNVSANGNSSTYTTQTTDGNSKKYYRCMSTNACYNAASTLTTVDVSNPVINVTATNITDNGATLNWTPNGTGDYNISYAGPTTGTRLGVISPHTFNILNPGGTYILTVTQATPIGCTATGTVTITTLCAAPTALKVTGTTTNSISVSWTGAAGNYRVYYTPLFSTTTTSYTKDVIGATSTSIAALTPGTTYKIYVSRLDCPTTGITGQPCAFIYGTTSNTASCVSPTIDSVKSICPTQVQVWLHGNTANKYQVSVQRLTPTLQPATTYTFNGGYFTVNVSTAGQTYLIAATSVCGSTVSNRTIWPAGIAIQSICSSVGNLLLSQPTCVGFTASWNPDNCINSTVSAYQLYTRKKGAIPWNAITVLPGGGNSPFKVVNTLGSATTYQCYIQSVYSCNGYSSYGPASAVQTMATLSGGCRVQEEEEENNDPQTQTVSTGNTEAFSIYPNPNNGEFIVDLSRLDNKEEPVRIEVINLMGQTILTRITSIASGHLNDIINMPNGTAAGTYFVRLTAGTNVYTGKVNVSR